MNSKTKASRPKVFHRRGYPPARMKSFHPKIQVHHARPFAATKKAGIERRQDV
jgi:hypothetical protein